MVATTRSEELTERTSHTTMRAAVFHGPVTSVSRRSSGRPPGPGEAVIRVTLTTICGTDVHILKGEYPVQVRA